MKIRVLTERSLYNPNISYKRCGGITAKDSIQQQIRFRKVWVRHHKKIVKDFYGELVYFEGSTDIKVILPLVETTEDGGKLTLREADYFMGKLKVKLSNPVKLNYDDVIMYDIEY